MLVNVEDAGPTLYKCYTNVYCLLGCYEITVSVHHILTMSRNNPQSAQVFLSSFHSIEAGIFLTQFPASNYEKYCYLWK